MLTVKYNHWFVTDGNMVIELGRGDSMAAKVIVHSDPKKGCVIDEEFRSTDAVRFRMKKVCGMTNYSFVLRNCEHVARYIQCGVWVSFQMATQGTLMKQIFKGHMKQENLKRINVFPDGLEPMEKKVEELHSAISGNIKLEDASKSYLDNENLENYNILFLGPTGAGKSTLINYLFNEYVNKTAATASSVTKQLSFATGSVSWIIESNSVTKEVCKKVNVIDTIGFCDTVLSADKVLKIIQNSIKINLINLDKVVIVCSGRIEGDHIKAITNFMAWLKYEKYKKNFVFIYNKCENLTSAEKKKNLLDLSDLLGAEYIDGNVLERTRDGKQKKMKHFLAVGFPPRASYDEIKEDYEDLNHALLWDIDQLNGVEGLKRIPVEEKWCSIL